VTGEQPPDEWTHDPDRPVPFITDQSSAQIGAPDDYDRRVIATNRLWHTPSRPSRLLLN